VSKPRWAFAAVIGVAASLMTVAASAQEVPGNKATVAQPPRAPLQAPVGHRQPRASDLPPAPQRPEPDAAAAPRDDTDAKLRICRGC
jgi:hypothetical protein